jgi:hypothetical protein
LHQGQGIRIKLDHPCSNNSSILQILG